VEAQFVRQDCRTDFDPPHHWVSAMLSGGTPRMGEGTGQAQGPEAQFQASTPTMPNSQQLLASGNAGANVLSMNAYYMITWRSDYRGIPKKVRFSASTPWPS